MLKYGRSIVLPGSLEQQTNTQLTHSATAQFTTVWFVVVVAFVVVDGSHKPVTLKSFNINLERVMSRIREGGRDVR